MSSQSLPKFESRVVISADGTRLHADATGSRSPSSPVIVMIHGFGMVKAAFDSMFNDPQWVSNAFLVRYDARGHGKSGKPTHDDAWESRRMSEDFEVVCNGFGVTKAFVMGWSLGASHFADIVNYNTSVTISGFICSSGLIYIDPAVIVRIANPPSLALLAGLTHTDVDVFQQAARAFVSRLSNHLPQELSSALLEGIYAVPKEITSKLVGRTQNPERMLQEARKGGLELLVISCGKDMFLDPEGYKAVFEDSGWKNYTLQHLEEADHMPWVSRPEEFREAMLGWMKERHHYL